MPPRPRARCRDDRRPAMVRPPSVQRRTVDAQSVPQPRGRVRPECGLGGQDAHNACEPARLPGRVVAQPFHEKASSRSQAGRRRSPEEPRPGAPGTRPAASAAPTTSRDIGCAPGSHPDRREPVVPPRHGQLHRRRRKRPGHGRHHEDRRCQRLAQRHGISRRGVTAAVQPHLHRASAHALAVTPTAHWLEHLDIAGVVLTERLLPHDGMVNREALAWESSGTNKPCNFTN